MNSPQRPLVLCVDDDADTLSRMTTVLGSKDLLANARQDDLDRRPLRMHGEQPALPPA